MKVLFLAPQPFFQERGTPIAVRLALQVISKRQGDRIDLLTYHEGQNVTIPGVTIHRISMPSRVKGVAPGISIKKLLCDLVFFLTALRMAFKARRDQYQLVHAVEESVFAACLLKFVFGIPYIYDMDSSLAMQITEKWKILRPVQPLLALAEKLAVRCSDAVVPVCDALAVIARKHGARQTTVLSDISLLRMNGESAGEVSLRTEAGLGAGDLALVYIGNLEHYQGIDLLLESLAAVAAQVPRLKLVIIGGRADHIAAYGSKASALNIADRVRLIGPRPVSRLNDYLCQADILVSPRIQGNNTPMKIYSYLHSGIPVLATRLYTHTQVLDDGVARLADPEVKDFSRAMLELAESESERRRLGKAARELAESKYTFERFEATLNQIYDCVARQIADRLSGAR